MYNRPPSLAPMRRTPIIAPPMSIRGSVGPMSMRGSMTPGPAGGASAATVASLKQKAIMIEMGDRIKSLEGGIGSMDERVRSMLDERMGPVEGLLREIIRGQANLAGGVGNGSSSGSGSSAERVEERRQATSASTTTPQRPPTSGLNGSTGEGASVARSSAVTPTASNGGMPPPTSVPRSAGSSNRIPKSILSSLSGTPLRKRIVDQRKAAGQSPGVVAAERVQAAQGHAQAQGQVQANAAFTSPAGMASLRSNTPTQPVAQAGSPHKPSSNATGAVLHQRQGSPSLAVSGPGPGQEGAGAAPPTAQYEHDELDGLDNSFDGLDGDVQEADGGSKEGERNGAGAGASHRAAGGSGAARGRKRKAV